VSEEWDLPPEARGRPREKAARKRRAEQDTLGLTGCNTFESTDSLEDPAYKGGSDE
jgi:hypothetical protein